MKRLAMFFNILVNEVFVCVLVMLRNKKSGIIGHLFRLKTEKNLIFSSWLFGCYALRRFNSLDEHGGSKASKGNCKLTIVFYNR